MAETFPIPRILMTGGRSRLAGVVRAACASIGGAVTSFSRTPGDGHLPLTELTTGAPLAEANVLLHLAWSTVPLSSERQPGIEQSCDLPLLRQLLQRICASRRRHPLHFVFFSSGGTVYGNPTGGRSSREDDICRPISNYGFAKLAAEQIVLEYAQREGLACTILRISNPYGYPVADQKPQGIVPLIIRHARENTPLTIWGDGTARKDFLHHTDFARALALILQQRLTGTYNVCSGESHSINELIELVEKVSGRSVITRQTPSFAWDVHESLLDNNRLCSALNWRPLCSIEQGISEAVQRDLPVKSTHAPIAAIG